MKTHNSYPIKYNQKNSLLKFGQFGIKINSFGRITQDKLDSLNRLLINFLKKITNNRNSIKVWKPVIFNLTLTKLSSESRMGKGKGSIYTKAIFFKPGEILFEISGISYLQMVDIVQFVRKKTFFKISLVKKFR